MYQAFWVLFVDPIVEVVVAFDVVVVPVVVADVVVVVKFQN
jgi:hypothetical protein